MSVAVDSAVAKRDRLLRGVDGLPPFSPILNRLMARLAREDVMFSEVSELIEKDTVLTGNLLRLVNSALYGLAGTINSARHALSILGIEKVRRFVLALSMVRLWRREPTLACWSSARFNMHSAATAIISDLLVQDLRTDYPEGAFTAGLMHDFGKLLLASAQPRDFEAIQYLVDAGGGSQEECEREVVGITHAELAAAALGRWNLPAPISRAVRFHHSLDQGDGHHLPLSRVVQAADVCVNRMQITVLETHPECGGAPEEVLAALGLADQAPRLLLEFDAELDLVKPFF